MTLQDLKLQRGGSMSDTSKPRMVRLSSLEIASVVLDFLRFLFWYDLGPGVLEMKLFYSMFMFSIAYPNLNIGRDIIFFEQQGRDVYFDYWPCNWNSINISNLVIFHSVVELPVFLVVFFLMVTSSLFDSQEAKNNPGYGIAWSPQAGAW